MARLGWQTNWHKHPGVRSGDQLTLGERAADRMRSVMGSWPFVFGFFIVMISWAVVNSVFYLGGTQGKQGLLGFLWVVKHDPIRVSVPWAVVAGVRKLARGADRAAFVHGRPWPAALTLRNRPGGSRSRSGPEDASVGLGRIFRWP
jgi:hypothetical protein